MILTGGEPMLRPDLLDIVRYISHAGLRPVMATVSQPQKIAAASAVTISVCLLNIA